MFKLLFWVLYISGLKDPIVSHRERFAVQSDVHSSSSFSLLTTNFPPAGRTPAIRMHLYLHGNYFHRAGGNKRGEPNQKRRWMSLRDSRREVISVRLFCAFRCICWYARECLKSSRFKSLSKTWSVTSQKEAHLGIFLECDTHIWFTCKDKYVENMTSMFYQPVVLWRNQMLHVHLIILQWWA